MIPITQHQIPINSQIQFSRPPTSIFYNQQQPVQIQQSQQFMKPIIQLPIQQITVPLIAQPQQQYMQTQYQYQPIQYIQSPITPQPQIVPQLNNCCTKQCITQPPPQCVQPICTLVLKPYKQDKCARRAARKCAKKAKKNNCLKC